MNISSKGIDALKQFEGCKYFAYQCSAGKWTIGYGFTKNVKQGDSMTAQECEARLILELADYEHAVWEAANGLATQNEFDAMVSLAWNIGIKGFRTSTVVKAHNRGDKAAASRAFGLWNKVDGKVNKGLTYRRAKEAANYLTLEPVIGITASYPMPQAVDVPKPLTNSTTMIAGGTAAIATVTQITDAVVKLKGSVTGLEDWLMPVIAVVALIAIGWVLYERWKNRQRGAI